jgi:hypothetical protein
MANGIPPLMGLHAADRSDGDPSPTPHRLGPGRRRPTQQASAGRRCGATSAM